MFVSLSELVKLKKSPAPWAEYGVGNAVERKMSLVWHSDQVCVQTRNVNKLKYLPTC